MKYQLVNIMVKGAIHILNKLLLILNKLTYYNIYFTINIEQQWK